MMFRKNPFTMTGTLEHTFLLNHAVSPEKLRPLIPRVFEPDLHKGHAFFSLVIVDLRRMRPAWLPAFMGFDYVHIGYRVPVWFESNGSRRRGVYFVRSDGSKRLFNFFGNVMTYFNFQPARVRLDWREGEVAIDASCVPEEKCDVHVVLDTKNRHDALPANSLFDSLEEATTFFTELEQGFWFDQQRNEVNIVVIERPHWPIKPIQAKEYGAQFFQDGNAFDTTTAKPDVFYHVQGVPYVWRRREIVKL